MKRLVLAAMLLCCVSVAVAEETQWWAQVSIFAFVLPKDRAEFSDSINKAVAELRKDGVLLLTTKSEFGSPGSIHPERDKRIGIYGRVRWELKTDGPVSAEAVAKIYPTFLKAVAGEIDAGRIVRKMCTIGMDVCSADPAKPFNPDK